MTQLRVPKFTCAREPGRLPIDRLSLKKTLHNRCDICEKTRSKGDHTRCSKIRQARGAEAARKRLEAQNANK